MHLSIKRQLRKQVAAVRLKCCSEIMNVDTAELGHKPVCTAGRNLPQQQVVNAVLAPTADNFVSLLELLQEFRNFCRIMLEIAIHGEHVVTFAVCKPSRQRCGLAKVST